VSARAAPGDLYVSDLGDGNIFKFTPDGTKSTFASGLAGLGGLAFDRSGNLFVAASGKILKFAPDGNENSFFSCFYGIAPRASLLMDWVIFL
jgi:sugar lactone lactonase YvrE